jgi:hypothetical protein
MSVYLGQTLQTGMLASTATTAVVAACGRWETGNPLAPLNAISHIVWGDQAAAQEALSLQYTGMGIVLNTAAVTSWAALQEGMFGTAAEEGNLPAVLLGGVAVATIAYITDYYLVPERLTPGFEKRLSGRSLLAIYGVLALSLGLGSLLRVTSSRRSA